MANLETDADDARQADEDAPRELLRLTDAQVRRDGRFILDVDSFVVTEGEHIAIIGPNGAGKSTLVKLLTREMRPLWHERAPVVFRGSARTSLQDINRTVGVVSNTVQERMMVHRTALDIVLGGFFGGVGVPYHMKASEQQVEAAHRALEEVGVGELATRDMLTLSTGQQRRVLVARALIYAPDALVFDEPCTGLDPEAVWNLRQTLSSLAAAGRTILLITHDVADIVCEFDRVIALSDGRIVADGDKRDILTTERLRALFGVPITLVEHDGRYHIQ